jgi:hypothetical protein
MSVPSPGPGVAQVVGRRRNSRRRQQSIIRSIALVRAQARIASSMTIKPHSRTCLLSTLEKALDTFRVRSVCHVDTFAPLLFGGRTMRGYDIVPVAQV